MQQQDADLNYTGEHQNSGEANVQLSKSRAASAERPVELFTFFAHASLAGRLVERRPAFQNQHTQANKEIVLFEKKHTIGHRGAYRWSESCIGLFGRDVSAS